jgi:hypothetical protein
VKIPCLTLSPPLATLIALGELQLLPRPVLRTVTRGVLLPRAPDVALGIASGSGSTHAERAEISAAFALPGYRDAFARHGIAGPEDLRLGAVLCVGRVVRVWDVVRYRVALQDGGHEVGPPILAIRSQVGRVPHLALRPVPPGSPVEFDQGVKVYEIDPVLRLREPLRAWKRPEYFITEIPEEIAAAIRPGAAA